MHKNPIELINKKLIEIFNNFEFITSDQLYEKIIPFVIEKQIYKNTNGSPINIDEILKSNYDYGPIDNNKFFAWKKKKN